MNSMWNPIQFFNLYSQPSFLLTTKQSTTKTLEALSTLSFDEGLRVIVASQPKFENKEWLNFQRGLAQSIHQIEYLPQCLEIARIMRPLLPEVKRCLQSRDKTSLQNFLSELNPDDLEQFALFACFYAYALNNIQARIYLEYLVRHFKYPLLEIEKTRAFYLNLPPRRKIVIQLAAYGYTNAEIAEELVITEASVAEQLGKAYAIFSEIFTLPEDSYGRRYRLIHYLTRLFDQEPNLALS